jgi:hypothetical protein
MGYGQDRRRVPKLTPFESELRATAPISQPLDQPPGAVRRLLRRLRRRQPPTTRAGAIGRGLIRLGVLVALGVVVSWVVAVWLDQAVPTILYIVGACVLVGGVAFVQEPVVDAHGRAASPVEVRPGPTVAAAGVVLLAAGVLFEILG